MNNKRWNKHIYDTASVCNFVINEFNSTFETQNMGNEAFENALFGNPSFGNRNENYSCLWAYTANICNQVATKVQLKGAMKVGLHLLVASNFWLQFFAVIRCNYSGL